MPKRDGYESRKNYLDENEVKSPVLFFNGQSAVKPRTEEHSTTIPSVKKFTTEVRLKRAGEIPLIGNGAHPGMDEDIVCSQVKACGGNTRQGVATLQNYFSLKIIKKRVDVNAKYQRKSVWHLLY